MFLDVKLAYNLKKENSSNKLKAVWELIKD